MVGSLEVFELMHECVGVLGWYWLCIRLAFPPLRASELSNPKGTNQGGEFQTQPAQLVRATWESLWKGGSKHQIKLEGEGVCLSNLCSPVYLIPGLIDG